MKRLIIFLFLTSVCFGDTYTTHQKPNVDSTLDIGTTILLWRYIYGDAFTDGTALWEDNALSGFSSIRGTVLTDGIFIISGGKVRTGDWQGTAIDISDYTNLIAGTNITLSGDTINVDDAFLINSADDTTIGIITAAGFTTIGAITAGGSTFGDGGTTNYAEFSDLGTLSLHGDARVERHIVIGAASWSKGATAPTASYETIFPTLIFADGQDDEAHYTTWVPFRWDSSTDMEVHVHWQHDDAEQDGKVLWKLNYIGVAIGEDPAGSGTLISQLSAGSHGQDELIDTIFATKILAANLEAEDDFGLKLWRDGNDGTDTLTDGAELIAMHIHFTMNELGKGALDIYKLLLETGDDLLLEDEGSIILENI